MTVDELSDWVAIQQLCVAYAHAIDSKQFDLLDEVFAPDAYADYRPVGGIDGNYPEIKQWLARVLTAQGPYQHFVGNFDIRLSGDTATGRIMCFNPSTRYDEDGQAQVGFFGLWYVDTYRRTDTGWRIQTRTEDCSFVHNIRGRREGAVG
jgi:hypothetical protein